jgi:hypothetical protein
VETALAWIRFDALAIVKGVNTNPEYVKSIATKILKCQDAVEEITFSRPENAADRIILTSSRSDLLDTLVRHQRKHGTHTVLHQKAHQKYDLNLILKFNAHLRISMASPTVSKKASQWKDNSLFW